MPMPALKPHPLPRPPFGPGLVRSLKRKLLVLAALALAMALWAGWQYSRRQGVDSQTLGDYRIDGRAATVLLDPPEVVLEIGAGLRRDHTARLARALAQRLERQGFQVSQLAARSDPERFGQTSRLDDRHASQEFQAQTLERIRQTGAPVLRVALDGLEQDGHRISEQRYRIELLDPDGLQPSWRAVLTWREGRYQSLALLWHLRQNRLPPPLWDSLADLALERLREDGKLDPAPAATP